MSRSYVLRPLAVADLEDIWAYGVERWGAGQAERYLRQVQRVIETVAEHPRQGRACDEIRPGYFKVPAGSHRVFYRLTTTGIEVVRILHQRMDIDRHI